MTDIVDAVVVGAGIVGTACADALAAQGLQVAVVESDAVGSGATAAGMGHLVVMDDNPAELALTRYSLTLWRALVAASETRHEYHRCGTLWIAADEEEMEAARAKQLALREQDIACDMLDADALYACEPHLRPGLAGGLRVHGDAIVYPPKTARYLLDRARKKGARLIHGEVREAGEDGVRLAGGKTIRARHTVIANGINALSLLPELPMQPKKGHLVITDRYPGLVRHQLVELGYIKSAHAAGGESVAFNVQPRPTGQLLIGSSRQYDVTGKAADMRIVSRMLSHAAGFMPMLSQLNALRCWTGFRAASRDGLPLIGKHPGRANVWLATGHEGLGITTSLATAALLAAQITGERPAIPPEPYLPERFTELATPHG